MSGKKTKIGSQVWFCLISLILIVDGKGIRGLIARLRGVGWGSGEGKRFKSLSNHEAASIIFGKLMTA